MKQVDMIEGKHKVGKLIWKGFSARQRRIGGGQQMRKKEEEDIVCNGKSKTIAAAVTLNNKTERQRGSLYSSPIGQLLGGILSLQKIKTNEQKGEENFWISKCFSVWTEKERNLVNQLGQQRNKKKKKKKNQAISTATRQSTSNAYICSRVMPHSSSYQTWNGCCLFWKW